MRPNCRIAILACAGALAGLLALAPAKAAPNPPIAGYPPNSDIGAVVTNALHATGTVTGTPSTANTQWRGVTCTFKLTVSSGSPTETWSIEGFDSATASWYQIATTATFQWGAHSATATTQSLTVYPGIATSSLSSGQTAQNAHLPRVWRLVDVIGGTAGNTPAATSTGGCNYLN